MRTLHRIAGMAALGLVATFWMASAVVELAGSRGAVDAVKQGIAWGLLVLVPSVIAANVSGMREAHSRTPAGRRLPPLLARKRRRGIIVAVVGLTVLAPCALWLAWRTSLAAPLDATFHAVQGVELVGGAINFVLLALNARDGYRMRKPVGPLSSRVVPARADA